MFPFLHIGPLTIPTPGLIVILGLWVGLSIAEKYSKKWGIEASTIYNLIFTSLIAGLIIARLVYVFRYYPSFIEDPISIILPNPNMLDLSGGLVSGALAALIYANRKKLDFWRTADALMHIFAMLSISASLANLASGNAFGSPANLPWSIDLWGARRHPVQLYEMLGASLVLWILWPSRSWLSVLKPGGLVLLFLALTSLNKLVLETFRGDSILVFEHYRAMQVLALAVLLISVIALRKKLPVPTSLNIG